MKHIDINNNISLKMHQDIMLDILVNFADFCEKNDLHYYLDAGTLLGAIRHKGFIPWDNDMDICLMRPDYDRMIELLRGKNYHINDHIVIELPENTIYPFSKIGDTRTSLIEYPESHPLESYVYIDVFPKDGLLDMGFRTKILCKISEKLRLWMWFEKVSVKYWREKKHGLKKLIGFIFFSVTGKHNVPFKLQSKLIRAYSKVHPLKKCGYVTTLVNGEYHRACEKKCFDQRVLLDFEGKKFYGPVGYDRWLKVLYGNNYMDIPPVEKQEVHEIIVTWRGTGNG